MSIKQKTELHYLRMQLRYIKCVYPMIYEDSRIYIKKIWDYKHNP